MKPEPEEDEHQRHDRQLSELSGELRVLLPGVTVLFAFLLTVPLSAGRAELQGASRAAYFVAFVATAASIVLLLGESAYHRLIGRPYDKGRLIVTASRQAVAGLALLGLALGCVTFFVTDVSYSRSAAVAVSLGVLALAVGTWFALPLRRRARRS